MSDSEYATTLSDELFNLSFDAVEEDADVAWFSLIQNLSADQLETLKNEFCQPNREGLTKEEFLNAICSLYGNSQYSLQSTLLFDEVNKENKPEVPWTDFLQFLLENIGPKTNDKLEINIHSINAIPHAKRETITKIVLLETDKYFCYAIISKHGRIGLYDGNVNFLTSYHVIMTREDVTRSEDQRRRRNRWVTDAVFCVDVLLFMVTNTARSIMIYEASGLRHVPLYLILSTPNVPECLAYRPEKNFNKLPGSCLYVGDSAGEILGLNFLQPKVGILRKKHNDKLNLFYWEELLSEKDYVTIRFFGPIHKNSVLLLKYYDEHGTLVSCCRDSSTALVKKHVETKRKSYIFKIPRGATTFALSAALKILITGSDDGLLRVWNSVLISKPIATMSDHQHGIVDVQILENQRMFISISRDGVLKLWDLTDYNCLQTIKIKFPCFGVEGKTIEWGKNIIHPGPKRCRASLENHTPVETCFDIDGVAERKSMENDLSKRSTSDVWERSNILVSCCNSIANVTMKFDDVDITKSFEMAILQPPPLQNSVLIPSSWRIPSSKSTSMEDFEVFEAKVDVDIEHCMKDLSFILEKDLLEEENLNSDINYKVAVLETKKLQMQKHVAQGAPYLALDLYDIEELKLSEDLPVPNKKKMKHLVDKTKQILVDALLKDQIFSEPSSSRSKSSRSSTVEFPI